MGIMNVLGPEGDITVEWDPDDAESTKRAKDEYDRLKKDGYEFFEVEEKRGKKVKRWSKKHGKILAAPGVKSADDRKTGKRGKAMAGGPNARIAA